MDNKKEILLRLSEIFEEASVLLKELIEVETNYADNTNDVNNVNSNNSTTLVKYNSFKISSLEQMDFENVNNITLQLLKEKGLKVKNYNLDILESEGLTTLAKVMGQKFKTIKPLLDQIKKSQSSRQRIYMDLSKQPQEVISDITLVANLAHQAGLLPNYKYAKSPKYKLFADAPLSPIAINFFTGAWLEIYAYSIITEFEAKYNLQIFPISNAHISLPNGDQFELDLIFTLKNKLIWIEAKTSDNFSRLLPKYKNISEIICDSPQNAILLWTNYNKDNPIMSARGTLAKMTLCNIEEFSEYLNYLFAKIAK